MSPAIAPRPLTREAFSPFGQVLTTEGARAYPINEGRTLRFHELATIEIAGEAGRPIISIFRGQPLTLPLTLSMMERHPLGSQAFMPLHSRPFLVVVAPDAEGAPGRPLAFLTAPGTGINIARNIWHGVLTPLEAPGDFLVVDRGGEGINLEEHVFDRPYTITGR